MVATETIQSKATLINKACRINVVGTSGSGKSTFAQQVAQLKGIPWIELDALLWKSNWQASTDDEFLPKVQQALTPDSWVLDGNYTRTLPIKWARTQAVVFIDLPFYQTLFRVSKRAIQRSLSRTELWQQPGTVETLKGTFFARDSVVLWAITHYHANRRKYLNPNLLEYYPDIAFIHLGSSSEVASCLRALESIVTEDRL